MYLPISLSRKQTSANIYPTKGSAGFWWDVYHYGGRDEGTGHGGCPVAAGAKWILNKWVYSHNQWDRQGHAWMKPIVITSFSRLKIIEIIIDR